jgi:hypothetical protein
VSLNEILEFSMMLPLLATPDQADLNVQLNYQGAVIYE